jgi:thioredoxin-dependent peroxiredoxin
MAKAANRVMLLVWVVGILALTTSNSSAGGDDKRVDLVIGDSVPFFQSRDDQGKLWKLADHLGKEFLVIYFYPGDFTPGCTAQAKAFRDNMEKLVEKGVAVIGISGDPVLNHQLFKKAQKLNFTLLDDENGRIAKKFGVPVGPAGQVKTKDANGQEIVLKRGVTAARWTFLIGKDGKIALKNTKVTPAQDSKQILEFVEHLQK